jgi:hypothetical protein
MTGKSANAVIWRRIRWPVGKITALENALPSDLNRKVYRSVVGNNNCPV